MPQRKIPHFDLAVIGGGPSGSIVANGAADAGMKVALIEGDQLGGTCLNYGCDPTNVMVRAGEVLSLARRAGPLGVEASGLQFHWPVLRAHIQEMIDEVRDGDGVDSIREAGIHLFQAHARLTSPHTIEAGDDTLTADRIMIATGSMPGIPDIPGLADAGYLTNRDIFTLEALPRSIAVIGSGPNAMEFAQAFLNFGLEVSVVTTDPGILPEEDTEVAGELERLLRRDGMDIHTGARDVRAGRAGTGQRRLTFSDDRGAETAVEAEAILVATARRPALDGLGLDEADIRHDSVGIHVDACLRTSVPHIWAVGDVTGIGAHTHVADYQAQIALHNILHPDALREAHYRVVPWKVFTQPEIGRVGMTEADARNAGHDVVVNAMPYRDLPRAIALNERDGLVKLVVDRASHRVLGGHVLGAYGSEVIAEVALVMQHDLPVTAIRETMHAHPTMAEGVYWVAHNIREALFAEPPPVP